MMKSQLKSNFLSVALLCGVSFSTQSQVTTNLAGSFRSVLFSIPSSLPIWRNTENLVVNVGHGNNFEASAGRITVSANNAFTYAGNELATGHLAWAGQGLLTAYSGTNTAVPFQINSGLDLLVSATASHEGFYDLELITRNPSGVLPEDFLNTSWSLCMLQTPARLIPQMYTNGVIYELKGRDHFKTATGSMTINSSGVASGIMDGPFSASTSYAGDGQVNLAIASGGGSLLLPFYVNAARDFMAGIMHVLSGEDNYQQVILALKTPGSASLADLQGMWRVTTVQTPRILSLLKNDQGDLADLGGKDEFEVSTDSIVIGHDGFFFSRSPERGHGSLVIDPHGLVLATVTNAENLVLSYTFGVNASKNTLAAVRSTSEHHELVLLTKAPAQPGNKQDFALTTTVSASELVLSWASGANRELQSSTNLVVWESLPGTTGQHSYSAPVASSGRRFYRVVETP